MSRLLVVGYGNDLRRDDGVGPAVARAVEAWGLGGVAVRVVHQLVPELAEEMARAGAVVFVDASTAAAAVGRERLEAGAPSGLGHFSDPRWLLALAGALYGAMPPAWLVTVPVEDLGLGEGLTPAAREGAARALALIKELAGELGLERAARGCGVSEG